MRNFTFVLVAVLMGCTAPMGSSMLEPTSSCDGKCDEGFGPGVEYTTMTGDVVLEADHELSPHESGVYVWMPPGVGLVIEPGTTVRGAVPDVRWTLFVDGPITIRGTEDAPVELQGVNLHQRSHVSGDRQVDIRHLRADRIVAVGNDAGSSVTVTDSVIGYFNAEFSEGRVERNVFLDASQPEIVQTSDATVPGRIVNNLFVNPGTHKDGPRAVAVRNFADSGAEVIVEGNTFYGDDSAVTLGPAGGTRKTAPVYVGHNYWADSSGTPMEPRIENATATNYVHQREHHPLSAPDMRTPRMEDYAIDMR